MDHLVFPLDHGHTGALDELAAAEAHEARATVAAGVVTLDGTVRWPSDVGVLEAIVARVPGVVAVDNQLNARESEPRLDNVPPLP